MKVEHNVEYRQRDSQGIKAGVLVGAREELQWERKQETRQHVRRGGGAMPETERARVWEIYNNTGKARWWERKRPSQRDCEKARIRIPILFSAPLLLLSSPLCRLCACSDEVATEADRRTTVLLMAESQIDVSDTWNNICSNQWDLTHSKSTVPI